MDDEQLERFEQAVKAKSEDAKRKSEEGQPHGPPPADLGEPSDRQAPDDRASNTRHGQVTADKWNQ